MYYPDELIEEIRSANDIVDVIASYVKLTKRGGSYFGLCPFHSEKTGSFSVSPGKQMYYCFGCHAGGNVITFIMQYENFSFDEAIKYLAERAGIRLPEVSVSRQDMKEKEIRTTLYEIHKIAANYYYHQLTGSGGSTGLDYFHGRKLTDETIRHFGLGYTGRGSDRLYKMLKEKGYSDEILKLSGLVTIEEKGTHDKFWNRVIFPLMDPNNKVIGFGGRVLGNGTPKYLNSPETKIFEKNKFLFGLNYARKTRKDFFFLCEGNLDVIAMHQAGYTNAVASLGTSLTSFQPLLIKRYVSKVILTYDSDSAGIAAAQRAIPMLNDAGISVKILDLSPCKDPDEFINTLGTDELDRRIMNAENSFLWSLGVVRSSYEMNDPQQKTDFEHKCAEKLCGFTEKLERENYIKAVSDKFMISHTDLRDLVNHMGNKGYGAAEYSNAREHYQVKKADEGIMRTESYILSVSAEDPELYRKICTYLKAEDFSGPLSSELFTSIGECFEKGISPASVLDRYEDDAEIMKKAAEMLNFEDHSEENDIIPALSAAILRVKQASIDRRSKAATDVSQLQEIIKEQALWKNRKIILK